MFTLNQTLFSDDKFINISDDKFINISDDKFNMPLRGHKARNKYVIFWFKDICIHNANLPIYMNLQRYG